MKAANFLIFILLISCNLEKPNEIHKSVNKVTVSFTGVGCESGCPFQAVSIDSTLNAYYFGGRNSDLKGYFTGKISQSIWDSIQVKFIKYQTIGIDSSDRTRTDHPTVEFVVQSGKTKKHFVKDTGEMSDNDLRILTWFSRNIIKSIKLVKSDSIAFETTLHNGIPVKTEVLN